MSKIEERTYLMASSRSIKDFHSKRFDISNPWFEHEKPVSLAAYRSQHPTQN
jgi:hypothetical protein